LEDPKKDRTLLAIELREKLPGRPPSEETLVKMISHARNNSVGDQDKLWSLVSLTEHPIPPEAILYVLKVWARAIEKDKPITIREALWVARLHSIFKAKALANLEREYEGPEQEAPLTKLPYEYQTKLRYALTSVLSDMDDIDSLLAFAQVFVVNEKALGLEDGYPATREGILSYWLNDAEAYGVLSEGQPSAGDLSTRISQEFSEMYGQRSEQRKEANHERPHNQAVQ
jgi:hypothetical protein